MGKEGMLEGQMGEREVWGAGCQWCENAERVLGAREENSLTGIRHVG